MKNSLYKIWFSNIETPNLPSDNQEFSVKNPDAHSIDQLKFIFSQAEKRLEDSHKTFDATTTKSVTLLTLSVAIFSTLVTYFFLQNDFGGSFSPKLFTIFALSIYIFCVLFLIVKNILPRNYQPTGSLPSKLLNKISSEFEGQVNEELVLKELYYSELVNYDFRINQNFAINSPRLGIISCTIDLLVWFPVFGLIIYFFASLLFSV